MLIFSEKSFPAGFRRNGNPPCIVSGRSTRRRPPVAVELIHSYWSDACVLICLPPTYTVTIQFAGSLQSGSLRRDSNGSEPFEWRWWWLKSFVDTCLITIGDYSTMQLKVALPTAVLLLYDLDNFKITQTTYTFLFEGSAVGNLWVLWPKTTRNLGRKYPQSGANSRNEAQI